MRIAVTTQDFKTVTAHAGRARRFIVYAGERGEDVTEVERLDLPAGMSLHELDAGPHPLDAVDMLVTASAGECLCRKMADRGVRVLITAERDPASAAAGALRGEPTGVAARPSACHCEGH